MKITGVDSILKEKIVNPYEFIDEKKYVKGNAIKLDVNLLECLKNK